MIAWSWMLRWAQKPGEEADIEHGRAAEGKVLVTIARDRMGYPTEQVWVDESIAWQWDDRGWGDRPCR
jgi:hypothetical protein